MNTAITNIFRKKAFSMVEVVFSLGIITLAILVLVGLFGSTLKTTKRVIDSDRANSVMHRINAYLTETPFATVYTNFVNEEIIKFYHLTVEDPVNTNDKLILWQEDGAHVVEMLGYYDNITNIVHGSVIVIILQKSPVEINPLPANIIAYPNGYLPIEVSVFALPDLDPARLSTFISTAQDIPNNMQQLFVYSAAITR